MKLLFTKPCWLFILQSLLHKKVLFYGVSLSGFIFILVPTTSGQQSFPNIGFETGNFNFWTGATGQCCPVYTPQTGIDTTRHAITSGTLTDSNSMGLVPVSWPGSMFSARLGNASGAAESERLTYSFVPTYDSLLLLLRFAVLLENASHPEPKQPRFGYNVTSTGGIPGGCISEQIIAGDTTYNFTTNGTVEVLTWQTRVIDLLGHSGETITITFETGDCEPGGHFGYAYIDAEIVDRAITSETCHPDGSVTLFAPINLNPVWFDGSTLDSVVIQYPDPSVLYTVAIQTGTNCEILLTKSLENEIPSSLFSWQTDCQKEVSFTNDTLGLNGTLLNWDFGDGTTGQSSNPVHTYTSSGNYTVVLEVIDSMNCKSRYSQNITASLSPQIDFVSNLQCTYELSEFTGNIVTTTVPPYLYYWEVNGIVVSENLSMLYPFYYPGTYQILLTVEDHSGCWDSTEKTIEINEFPDCEGEVPYIYIPNAFTPNGDGINDFFEIKTLDLNISTLSIYNRFGEQIYTGTSWNGSFNKTICPEGIYGYTIQQQKGNKIIKETGTVLLLR